MINDYYIYVMLVITITAIPGPAVVLAIKNSIRYGFKISIAGIFANFFAMVILATISALGLGAIILASATIFTIVKTLGGAYLVYLGVKAWRTPVDNNNNQRQLELQSSKKSFIIFKEGFWVGISNPKAIAFFTALFPQFIDPSRSFIPQFLTLIISIETISCFILMAYAMLSVRVAKYLCKESSIKLFHKLTGGVFIGFGAALLCVE